MCCECGKGWAIAKMILGALLLLNAFIWPQWTTLTGWIAFGAILMIVGSIIRLIWPPCCKAEEKPAKKRKK